jgi:AAA family ATP:ADP antiporter
MPPDNPGCAWNAAQDVLVVTAPGSGAEIIPFLKTWVNLPMAIAFTIGYAQVS